MGCLTEIGTSVWVCVRVCLGGEVDSGLQSRRGETQLLADLVYQTVKTLGSVT